MILDGDEGNVIECDRCGIVHDFEHGDFEIKHNLWREIFRGRPHMKEVFHPDFCEKCAIEITPIVYQLRDIAELRYFENKLRRTISECKRQH